MKLFVITDMHSHYSLTKAALDKAGFKENDPSHLLIVCGDAFDRGFQAREMLEYLNSVERKVLIKGNHDDMLMDLLTRQVPKATDELNGTLGTVYQLGHSENTVKFTDYCANAMAVYAPLYESMKDYFETENHIFVHSWLPISSAFTGEPSITFWRNAPMRRWQAARWSNPYRMAEAYLLPEKTLVFGHWHTSWPRAHFEGEDEFGTKADFSPYYGKGYIGLDAMTSHTGIVNVLVLEDNLL